MQAAAPADVQHREEVGGLLCAMLSMFEVNIAVEGTLLIASL